MLHSSRRFIGPIIVAAAIVVGAFGAAPVAARHTNAALDLGAITVDVKSGALKDKNGTVTLRAKYACMQYGAPYDGTDILIVSITSSSTGGYDAFAFVTCDGTDQQLTLSLEAFNGGVSGPANLQFGHQGISPDGSIATISAYVDVPIEVGTTGHE